MSTGIMRQTVVVVLSAVWILWSRYVLETGESTFQDRWEPLKGFETRDKCVSASEKDSGLGRNIYEVPLLLGEDSKGYTSLYCLPVSFNPR